VKTAQLQIRLSLAQKVLVKRRAAGAGLDVSSYVLSLIAPASAQRFDEALHALRESGSERFVLAELSDLLADLSSDEFEQSIAGGLPDGLSPRLQNLVTAMVEHAAKCKCAAAPIWARDVLPLAAPWFATDLTSLRAHLLRVSPTAFRRRNLFVDSTVGDRV
jgi:uncharacterized protein (DUF1778 family)